jgi:cardiolipin synthase A/B
MKEITESHFYTRVRDAWDAMYADCESAKCSIDLEQYIFYYDDLGKKFIELFIKKALEGVKVRILCDMVGGIGFYRSPAVKELKNAGVEVLFFHPIKLWRINTFTSWYYRDHRKILIVDSEIGYIGGVGINKKMEDWRDTHVRVKGEVIKNMEYVFGHMWNNALTKRFYPFSRKLFTTDDTAVITNSPHWGQRFIYWQMVEMIRHAKQYIYMTTPYFIPGRRMMRVIRVASKRGVDVRLLMPAESDVRIANLASRSYYKALLRFGVRIFQYEGPLLHAKTMVIDDTWGTVGSTNMDNLSFRFNYEVNISTSEQKFIQDIKYDFLKDLEISVELQAEALDSRPVSAKIIEFLLRPIHKFL